MAFLHISDVYAQIHKILREDIVICELMGFTENTSELEKATRIQKRKNPIDLVKGNLPLITFYKMPGRREYPNHMAYVTPISFDVYTGDDVELAIDLVDRINDLFDDTYLDLPKGSSFKGSYITSGEDDTDLENTFKYFTLLEFTFGIEG